MKAIDSSLAGGMLIAKMQKERQRIDNDMKSSFSNKRVLLKSKEEELEKEREVLLAMEKNDSSENVPLHTARENVSRLSIEISSLRASADAYDNMVNTTAQSAEPGGVCTIGSVVCIQDQTMGVSWIIKLYPSGLGNAKIGAISIDTPLGRALHKHTRGEIVTCTAPGGVTDYLIKEVL